MGRFSHEQEARVGKNWYLTNDRGNYQYLFKFVPDRANDLTTGNLYGLVFDRATNSGHWVGPLDPFNAEADMVARAGPATAANSFEKAEGMLTAPTGDAVVFTESGALPNPGNVWKLTDLDKETVHGEIIVAGSFAQMARPDNIRYTDAGDLFIMEDHGSADFAQPGTGGANQIWVLPRGETGAEDLVHFATLPNRFEPTGMWFSSDNRIMYLSVQADPPFQSRVIAIQRTDGNFNQLYDR
jgi:secreted PhoX family phosphatase